mgnify:CR=1 FL=1
MREILVHLDEGHTVAAISLPVGLSDLMTPGVSYPWGKGRVFADSDLSLRLSAPEEAASGTGFWDLLTGIQAGLLFLALSKVRLLDPGLSEPFPDLDAVACRTDLRLASGERGVLALWSQPSNLPQAIRIASGAGLAHFVVQKGRVKSRPRLSVMIPHKMSEWGLDRVTALQVLRVNPRILSEHEAAQILSSSQAPEAGPVRVQGEAETSVPAWEDPFWDLFCHETETPPPVSVLDRLAEKACRRLCAPPPAGFSRSPSLAALSWAWRMGAGGPNTPVLRRLYPADPVHNRLRDRARVLDQVVEDGDGDLLRQVVRVSMLQAWRIGFEGRGGQARAPQGTFYEEREAGLRDLSPEAQEVLLRIHNDQRVSNRSHEAVQELSDAGLIKNLKTRSLTRSGKRLLRQSLQRPADAPSIREISRPTKAVMRTLRVVADTSTPPSRPFSRNDVDRPWDAPFRRRLIAEDGAAFHVGEIDRIVEGVERLISDPELTRKRFHRALNAAYRVGRSAATGKDESRRAPSPLVTRFLRERARALETLPGPEEVPGLLAALLRISCLQAWRTGVDGVKNRFTTLDARFLEEDPRELWDVSEPARALLYRLGAGVDGSEPDPEEVEELVTQGLLRSVRKPSLTRDGRAVLKKRASLDKAPSLRVLITGERGVGNLLDPSWSPPQKAKPKPKRKRAPTRRSVGKERSPRTLTDEEVEAALDLSRGDEALRALLIRSWTEGRYDPQRKNLAQNRTVPTRISQMITERVSAIRQATRLDHEDGDLDLIRQVIREQAASVFRIGTRTNSRRVEPPPAEYAEECSVPMRPVPPPLRDPLIRIHQGEMTSGIPRGVRLKLRRRGLLTGDGSDLLTDAGRALVLAEIEHRNSGLASIRPGGPRRAPAPRTHEGPPEEVTPPDEGHKTSSKEVTPPDAGHKTPPKNEEAPDAKHTAPLPGPPLREVVLNAEDRARILEITRGVSLTHKGFGRRAMSRLASSLAAVLNASLLAGSGDTRKGVSSETTTRSVLYIRDRATLIAEVASKRGDRVIPDLLLDSATEMFRIGRLAKRKRPLDLPPRFAEEWSQAMRGVPYDARRTLMRTTMRAAGRISADYKRLLTVHGLIHDEPGLRATQLGASIVEAELLVREWDRPSILSLLPEADPSS